MIGRLRNRAALCLFAGLAWAPVASSVEARSGAAECDRVTAGNARPVVFLYVQGIGNRCEDSVNFTNKAMALHREIRREFSTTNDAPPLVICTNADVFVWSCTPGLPLSRGMTEYLLEKSANENALIPTWRVDRHKLLGVGFLLRQIYGLILEPLLHAGGAMQSRDLRSAAFNFLHDPPWITNDEVRTNLWADLDARVGSLLDRYPEHDIVLAGHSGGSLLLFDYLYSYAYRLSHDEARSEGSAGDEMPEAVHRKEGSLPETLYRTLAKERGAGSNERILRLRGLITFGSQLGTVQAAPFSRWNDTDTAPINEFADHFLRESRFWLHVNHRNDPLGFHIPDEQLTFKNLRNAGQARRREGVIRSHMTKRGFWDRIPIIHLITGDPTLFKAHGWYWDKPEKFARTLRRQYEAGFRK